MAGKKVSIKKVLARAEEAPDRPPMIEISHQRLAVDLLRCMLNAFKVRTVQIPDFNLPENRYPSSTFVKELSRPAVFFTMVLRDYLRNHFRKFQCVTEGDQRGDNQVHAEGDAKAKDKDEKKDAEKSADKTVKNKNKKKKKHVKVLEPKGEDKTKNGKAAGDEDKAKDEGKAEHVGIATKREKLELDLKGLFDNMKKKADPDIYKTFIVTIVFCSELTQYLDSINKADLIEHIPGAWVKLFEGEVRTEFQKAGYFEEYLSYWAVLNKIENHINRCVIHFTPYEKESSQKFGDYLSSSEDFKDPEIKKKVFGLGEDRPADYWQTVKQFGFYPHEKLVAASEAAAEGDKSEASNTAGSDGSRSAKAKAKKLKPTPGQTYSKLHAQKKAEKEQQQRELDRLADRVDRAEILRESDDEDSS